MKKLAISDIIVSLLGFSDSFLLSNQLVLQQTGDDVCLVTLGII